MAVMEVIWHEKALKQVEDVLDYCQTQFGLKVAKRVANKIDRDVQLLSLNPYMGAVEESLRGTSCYRYLVEGPSKLLYTIEDGYIFIHLFWDCRQNPSLMVDYLD